MNVILTESQLQNLLLEVTTTKDGCEKDFYRDCSTKQCIKKPKNTIVVYSQKDFNKQTEINKISKQKNLYAKTFCDKHNKWAKLIGGTPQNCLSDYTLSQNTVKIAQIPGNLSNVKVVKDTDGIWRLSGFPKWDPNAETVDSYVNRYKKQGYSFTGRVYSVTEGEFLPQFKVRNVVLGCLSDPNIKPEVKATELQTQKPITTTTTTQNPNKEYAYRTQTILKQNVNTGKYTDQTLRKVAYAERDKGTTKWNYLNPPTVLWVDPSTGKELDYKPGTK